MSDTDSFPDSSDSISQASIDSGTLNGGSDVSDTKVNQIIADALDDSTPPNLIIGQSDEVDMTNEAIDSVLQELNINQEPDTEVHEPNSPSTPTLTRATTETPQKKDKQIMSVKQPTSPVSEVISADLGVGASTSAAAVPGNFQCIRDVLREHYKQILVLSRAGKPVFAMHGDVLSYTETCATLAAITGHFARNGDNMRWIKTKGHLIGILAGTSLIILGASRLAESEYGLRVQLELVKGQLLCLLTTAIDRLYAKKPSYDARRLIGDSSACLRALVHVCTTSPLYLMNAYQCDPLAPVHRKYLLQKVEKVVKDTDSLAAFLFSKDKLVAKYETRGYTFSARDILLLNIFLQHTPAFKVTLEECSVFTPVCLPYHNPNAFYNAFVAFLHLPSSFQLCVLARSPNHFHKVRNSVLDFHSQLPSTPAYEAVLQLATHPTHMYNVILRAINGATVHRASPVFFDATPLVLYISRHVRGSEVLISPLMGVGNNVECQVDIVALVSQVVGRFGDSVKQGWLDGEQFTVYFDVVGEVQQICVFEQLVTRQQGALVARVLRGELKKVASYFTLEV